MSDGLREAIRETIVLRWSSQPDIMAYEVESAVREWLLNLPPQPEYEWLSTDIESIDAIVDGENVSLMRDLIYKLTSERDAARDSAREPSDDEIERAAAAAYGVGLGGADRWDVASHSAKALFREESRAALVTARKVEQ